MRIYQPLYVDFSEAASSFYGMLDTVWHDMIRYGMVYVIFYDMEVTFRYALQWYGMVQYFSGIRMPKNLTF